MKLIDKRKNKLAIDLDDFEPGDIALVRYHGEDVAYLVIQGYVRKSMTDNVRDLKDHHVYNLLKVKDMWFGYVPVFAENQPIRDLFKCFDPATITRIKADQVSIVIKEKENADKE
ncbi:MULTISPECIES: hypothetical protein [Lactobacillus]|uniref:Uncharacterized protein n=1 Tax=Lactobacillus xujianguonis TaxID=2495899 RepID=A0A437STJ7_9LACO|nr:MULTISPECIES: hypothetical protein [Lactobacillus]RVU70177.1 hypothetical protein EJK17_09095 [Lactobacillus xujianguonis]RVU73518.1 hypothetical protein EJK20_07745 [Lactobacillus xujianguonis]